MSPNPVSVSMVDHFDTNFSYATKDQDFTSQLRLLI